MTNPEAERVEFADEDALAWLRRQPGGKVETSGAELARQWGWSRQKVSRRLQKWCDEGHLAREAAPDRKSVITLVSPVSSELPASVAMPEATHGAMVAPSTAAASTLPVPTPEAPAVADHAARPRDGRVFVMGPERYRRRIIPALGGLVLAAIAIAIAWFGVKINAWYGATLGKTAEASLLLAGLSVAADVLALILPAAARTLWLEGKRIESSIAWGLWTATIMTALLASVGFASVNIADTAAARDRVASEGNGLSAQIARMTAERGAIAEIRSVASIEAELQRAQPGAAAVWKATSGCTDVTRTVSGEACAEVLKLRQALGAAHRRDELDAGMHEAQAKLAQLPPVMTADPQAETAAKLLNWVTWNIGVRPGDIHLARVLGMTLLPQISGLVFMLATALWQPERRREALA